MPRTRDGTSYELSGDPRLPALVLIHGVGLNRQLWRWHVPDFAMHFHVVTYDLYGHGDSERPDRPLSLAGFSEQVRRLLDEIGVDRAYIAGFSLGGMINRRFALDHPARVAALAVLNSPHQRTPEAQSIAEQRAAETAAAGPAAGLEATLERWFTPSFRTQRPEIVEEVRAWVLANDAKSFAEGRRVLAHGVKELVRPHPAIQVPAIVMTSENDIGSTPAMAQAISGEIRGSRTAVIPHLRHLGLIEAPGFFVHPILRFLASLKDCRRLSGAIS